MAFLTKEYLMNIVPKDLPNGYDILAEGVEIGKGIELGETRFLKDNGYANNEEYIRENIEQGKVMFSVNIGMATIKDQIEAFEELSSFSRKYGFMLNFLVIIPSMNLAIPKELRDNVATATSFIMDDVEDYIKHEQVEGLTVNLGNSTVFVPNAIETTIGCIRAGSKMMGDPPSIKWDYEGCNDTVKYVEDMLRSVGIIKSKRDQFVGTTGYVEDGIGGNCVDCVSNIAYMMLERYIYEELCGIVYKAGIGGLVTNNKYKAALLKAADKVCRTEDHSGLNIFHASTTLQWDHDLETNYGPSMQEVLFMILAERHYKTGTALVLIPTTEAVGVPNVEGLKNIIGAAARMAEYAEQWEDLIDWSSIDEIADVMLREGHKMFVNIMEAFDDAGIDTKDPLQMMMAIKNINAALFEETFHPTVKEKGKLIPYFPNDMGIMIQTEIDRKIKDLTDKGYSGSLKGKKILVASLDGHVYGMRYVNEVLTAMGAEVLLGGVDNTPQTVLDLADEEGIDTIAVSTHNGQSLGFAQQLKKMMSDRDREYYVIMGGVLNTILPGHSEPSDVTDMIRDLGVFANNDLEQSIDMILAN